MGSFFSYIFWTFSLISNFLFRQHATPNGYEGWRCQPFGRTLLRPQGLKRKCDAPQNAPNEQKRQHSKFGKTWLNFQRWRNQWPCDKSSQNCKGAYIVKNVTVSQFLAMTVVNHSCSFKEVKKQKPFFRESKCNFLQRFYDNFQLLLLCCH